MTEPVPTWAVGQLVTLTCDAHRPRRVMQVVEQRPTTDVQLVYVAESLCHAGECGYCDVVRANGLRAGIIGGRAPVPYEGPGDVQPGLW